MTEAVWSRQFGQARITVMCEGTGWWPLERALVGVPEELWRPLVETDDENRKLISFNLVHVQTPGASIVLDTGFGDFDPAAPNQSLVPVDHMQMTGGLDAGLSVLGIARGDITHVLISHMHADHIGGATRVIDGRRAPAFPNARYYVMEDEWHLAGTWHQPLAYVPEVAEVQKQALLAAGVVELVRGQREVAAGVELIPAPGESPGHAIVRVATGGAPVYYLGDLFHQPAEFLHPDWMPRYKHAEMLIATRKQLLPRFVAEDAWLVLAHEPLPAMGRVAPAGAAYCWIPFSA